MAKLGLPRHRYAVAILCWFNVIFSLLIQFYCIFGSFYGPFFVIASINLAIACFGLYSLYRESDTMMKSFGIIQIIMITLQFLDVVGLFVLALFKEAISDKVLKIIMKQYYASDDYRDIMDELQEELKCCGRQSYHDWTVQPYSCCTTSDCSSYHSQGCVAEIGSIFAYILLVIGLIFVVSAILQIYVVVSAFALARVYGREKFGPIQPNIKHGIVSF